MKKFPVGLQPYTLREAMEKDYFGAIEKVAEVGYKGIEVGMPPAGITVAQLKAKLDELGLQALSAHVGLDQLKNDLGTIINFLKEVGAKYVVLSQGFETKEAVLEAVELYNKVGKELKEHGLGFLHHNHDWEFVKFDGKYALDMLIEETDPDLVKFEIDTYWVKKGGEDPAEYMKKLNNRCPLLHIKDMEPGEEQFFAEVGEGILNFEEIFKVAEEIGTEWIIVEQDLCRRDEFECIKTSYENLEKMGVI
ncbi:sugar phosphate isomerase/epimerase family protein [Lederbergia graminis]|uniref:Sugar phosphate isomerase/epimerase family protein n=1 Tax=Lederbergia graminis TaxID=735518 RepID=A0ABW0LJV7_9BACI